MWAANASASYMPRARYWTECSGARSTCRICSSGPHPAYAPAFKAWLEQGGTHHEIIVPGDYAARVRLLCRLLGIEFVEV